MGPIPELTSGPPSRQPAAGDPPDVDIVVPVYNEEQELAPTSGASTPTCANRSRSPSA